MRKRLVRVIILLMALLSVSAESRAQDCLLRGVVMDADTGERLIGASVKVEGFSYGCITDTDGTYKLKLTAPTQTVCVSYMGYVSQCFTIVAQGRKEIKKNVKLVESSQSLEEIVVTAKNEARQLRQAAMPVSVITAAQLQGTVSDVNDILSKTVGVTIRNTGGVGSAARFSVRGLEGKRIGLFLDDQPMDSHSDFVSLNDIPLDMIERIEVYKGVVPARLGGSAVGGAINIIIKDYPPRYHDVSYEIGSFNTHKVSTVNKYNMAEKGLLFGFGGGYTYADNNFKMESPYYDDLIIRRDHDNYNKVLLGASVKATKWWFDKVEIEPAYIRTRKEIQGIEQNIQHAHSGADLVLLNSKLEKADFIIPGLDLDFRCSAGYAENTFVDTSAVKYNWDGTTFPSPSTGGGETGRYGSDALNKKFNIQTRMNLNYLLNNTNSLNLNLNYIYVNNHPKDAYKDAAVGYQTMFDSKMHSFVAGLNYELRSADERFLSSLTAKYYLYGMDTRQIKILMAESEPRIVDVVKQDWGVSESVRYRLGKDLFLKGSAAYDVRLPAENELLGDGYIIAPATDLTPERNLSFNIGGLLDRKFSLSQSLSVEINVFYNLLDNMIRYTSGPLQSVYENFGKMSSWGVEAEVKGDITPWFYAYANSTYQDLRDRREYEPNTQMPNSTKGLRIPNVPYFLTNAGIELHRENLLGGKGQNTRLSVDAVYIAEYFYDFEQSIYQERRIPESLTFNAALEHSFGDQRWTVTARVNNLTDRKVVSEFNHPLPGRSFALKLRYIFK